MQKKKIGIDIDEVIVDSTTYFFPALNRKFKLDLKFEDVNNFRLENVVKVANPQKMIDFIVTSTYTDQFHQTVKPIPQALKTIQKLKENGFKIYFISSRPGEIKQKTKDWLKKHGFLKYSSNIIHTELYPAKNKRTKKDIAQKLKLNYFVDDGWENIIQIAEIKQITCFLMDRPWNQQPIPKNVIRVKDWKEIETVLFRPQNE